MLTAIFMAFGQAELAGRLSVFSYVFIDNFVLKRFFIGGLNDPRLARIYELAS